MYVVTIFVRHWDELAAVRAHQAPPTETELDGPDQKIGRGVKPLRVAHHGDRDIRVGDGRRPACVVDHVQDATEPGLGEEDRE
jgi:hypothetical protein